MKLDLSYSELNATRIKPYEKYDRFILGHTDANHLWPYDGLVLIYDRDRLEEHFAYQGVLKQLIEELDYDPCDYDKIDYESIRKNLIDFDISFEFILERKDDLLEELMKQFSGKCRPILLSQLQTNDKPVYIRPRSL